MLNKKLIALSVAALSTIPMAASAESYRGNVGLDYTKFSAAGDMTVTGPAVHFNLAPVSRDNAPWDEADFIEKSSYVDASILKTAFGPVSVSATTISGHGIIGDKFIAELDVISSEGENFTNIAFGAYLSDTSSVQLKLNNATSSLDLDSTMAVSYHSLISSGNAPVAIDVSLFNSKVPGTTLVSNTMSFDGTYYLDKAFGLGAGVALTTGDLKSTAFNLTASKYFGSNIYVDGTLGQLMPDVGDSATEIGLSGSYVF